MVDKLSKRDVAWLDGLFGEVEVSGVQLTEVTEDGFKLEYDPTILTAHQANEMIAIAERDGLFTDYGVDVESNEIFFKH